MTNTPNIQVGSLDFENIKSSLIDYLKTQEIIKDYEFEGSAIQVLLDVLAYNTMYQAFYLNMVANESFLDTAQRLQSIISLVKPLGYVVPGKVSAVGTAKIRQGGLDTVIPRYTRFVGRNEEGISFNFYSNESIVLDTDGEGTVDIFEGKRLVAETPIEIDQGTQKGFLSGIDIDLRTLRVEVKKPNDVDYQEYSLSTNINTNITDESRVYFLERSELGYFLVFGGRSSTGSSDQIGVRIDPEDLVRVSYIVSSGSVGNRCSGFSGVGTPGTTETVNISSGGLDEPDIEEIKFFAPKWFASQDRAVTVNDCKAILAKELGLGREDFNVFGGEEIDPPYFGRVFFTLAGNPNESQVSAAQEANRVLKSKCVVSILPEFIAPYDIVANVNGRIEVDGSVSTLSPSQVKSKMVDLVSREYPTTSFNKSISFSDLSNIISSIGEGVELDPNNASIEIQGFITPSRNTYFLRQPCLQGSFRILDAETNISNFPVNYESYGLVNSRGEQKVRAFRYDENTNVKIIESSNAGVFNASKGSFTINGIQSNTLFSVLPQSSKVVSSFETRLGVNVGNVQVTSI